MHLLVLFSTTGVNLLAIVLNDIQLSCYVSQELEIQTMVIDFSFTCLFFCTYIMITT